MEVSEMTLHAHKAAPLRLILRLSVCVCAANMVLCGAALADSELSLIDQGWQIVTEETSRRIEMSSMVINEGEVPLQYKVRFIVERSEGQLLALKSTEPAEIEDRPTEPPWTTVRAESVEGGPLAPSMSAVVTASFPAEVLEPGRAHRFRSELSEASTGPVVAEAVITSLEQPFLTVGGVASVALPLGLLSSANPAGLPGESAGQGAAVDDHLMAAAKTINGAGQMNGTHTSHRIGGQWYETGYGSIRLKGSHWTMVIQRYDYTATGADAESLTATLSTAIGRYYGPEGQYLVRITSADAQMTRAGTRRQSGDVIYRSGSRATGIFEANMTKLSGDGPAKIYWSGSLTLFAGKMSLDLSTNRGAHRYQVHFNATQM